MNVKTLRSSDRAITTNSEFTISHSFNYGNHFNPLRERFGVLRVLNVVNLSSHCKLSQRDHKNIEILILPIYGEIEYNDTSGLKYVIDKNEALLISTGSLTTYRLGNATDTPAEFIEIWIFAGIKNTSPSVTKLNTNLLSNDGLQLVAAGESINNNLILNQDAYIWKCSVIKGRSISYKLMSKKNILLLYVINGIISIESDNIYIANEKDSFELTGINSDITVTALESSDLILVEVPVD